MLRLAIGFLVIALIASFLGFGANVDYVWAGATVLLVVLLVLTTLTLLGGAFKRRSM